ncbi:MAG: hypothetical protein K8I03_13525 [Ignavibacteria bacterium]|nr:hypothetical protein [Ignavibacteria bacterium]
MKSQKHKVPLLVRLYHWKNTGFPTILDRILKRMKPPEKYGKLPGKILFNRNDKIGDAFVTLPVLRDLKLNHPSVKIDVLCSETNRFVFDGLEYISKVHVDKGDATESELKAENYDAIIDLVSVNKYTIRMLKRCSPFLAGSRIFARSWTYDYYLDTNWVSEYDEIPMSLKIEFLLKDCFDFKFEKRNTSAEFKSYETAGIEKQYDVLLHLGSSDIRKLDRDIEEALLDELVNYRVLITDGNESERYSYYRSKYLTVKNVTFRLYDKLEDMHKDASLSHVVLCYDGGQAHYLGQFSRCIVLVGTLLLKQWAPYDFSCYILFRKWDNGVEAYISEGSKEHFALNFPLWCLPCFNVGCKTRPCINKIKPEQIIEIVKLCLGDKNLAHNESA